ncbi:MAG: hypothetical protein HRO68_07060 [Nitrosopumilus sp.]|nr:hypothetical protein [Nitrosopumilus sp.]
MTDVESPDAVMMMAPLDMAKMDELDEIVQEGKSSKLVVINETAIQYELTFETSAPVIDEIEQITNEEYEKTLTVSHNSTLHYTDVKTFTDIPEEYVLFGTPFVLEWVINGTTVNILEDPRFEVEFVDTTNSS